MTHKVFIQRRILILEDSNKSFQRISYLLLFIGLAALAIPFIIQHNESVLKYAEFGFGCISFLIPLYLNSERSKRKEQILGLEFLLQQIDDNPQVIQEEIIKKILEKL